MYISVRRADDPAMLSIQKNIRHDYVNRFEYNVAIN